MVEHTDTLMQQLDAYRGRPSVCMHICVQELGRCVPIREVSLFQSVLCTGLNGVGT